MINFSDPFLIQETAQFGIDTAMFGAGAGGFGAFTQAPGITVTTVFFFIEYKQIVTLFTF